MIQKKTKAKHNDIKKELQSAFSAITKIKGQIAMQEVQDMNKADGGATLGTQASETKSPKATQVNGKRSGLKTQQQLSRQRGDRIGSTQNSVSSDLGALKKGPLSSVNWAESSRDQRLQTESEMHTLKGNSTQVVQGQSLMKGGRKNSTMNSSINS